MWMQAAQTGIAAQTILPQPAGKRNEKCCEGAEEKKFEKIQIFWELGVDI